MYHTCDGAAAQACYKKLNVSITPELVLFQIDACPVSQRVFNETPWHVCTSSDAARFP